MAYKEPKLTKEAAKALNEHWNDGVVGKGNKKKPADKKDEEKKAPVKKAPAKAPAKKSCK